MADPKIRYDILANAEGEEDVARLATELEKLDEAIDPQAAARAKALADELRALAERKTAIEAFLRALADADNAAKALETTTAAADKLGRQLAETEKPTRSQVGQLEKLNDAARKAQTAYTQQTAALNGARVAVEKLGVGTADLGTKQQLVNTALASTRTQAAQLAASYQATATAAAASAATQVRAQGQAKTALDGLNDTYRRLQGVAAVAIGGGIFSSLIGDVSATADAYSNLQARIKLVTGEGQAFTQAFDGVSQVAQRTSSSLESTGTLFTRIAQAGRDIGVSQQEALSLTETINQTLALSGASAASSDAAITQLIQGLQSGVLRGEEFNSVVEQSPRLAQALADGLGVARGELRNLANQGKLTSEIVIQALRGQSETVAKEFATLPPTVGRAIQNLSTNWTLYVGEVDKANGVSEAAARAINALAENLDTVGALLLAAGKAAAAYKAVQLAQTLLAGAAAARLSAAAKAQETLATQANTAATLANTAAKAGNVTATAAGAAASGAAAASAGAGVAGLLAKGASLLRLTTVFGLIVSAVYLVGSAIADVFGLRSKPIDDATAKLEANAEAAEATAEAHADLAEEVGAVSTASTKLSVNAKRIVDDFGEVQAKATKAGDAVAKLSQSLDLGSLGGIQAALSALNELEQSGKLAGDQIREAIGGALKDLDLVTFKTQAMAAFDGTEAGARKLKAALDAVANESLRRLGTSVDELRSGFSEAATLAINDFDTVAETLKDVGVDAESTGRLLATALDKATSAANTEKAVQAVIDRLEELGREGKLSGDQLTDGLEKARKKLDELKPGINSLTEAYRTFGLSTRTELQAVADKNRQAWQVIKNDATLSIGQKQQAFKQYADSAIAANGGVASSELKVEAAAQKVQIQVDKTGKATVASMDAASAAVERTTKRFNELGQEVNAYGDAINQTAGNIGGKVDGVRGPDGLGTIPVKSVLGPSKIGPTGSSDFSFDQQVPVPSGYYYTLDPYDPNVERSAGYDPLGRPYGGYFAKIPTATGGGLVRSGSSGGKTSGGSGNSGGGALGAAERTVRVEIALPGGGSASLLTTESEADAFLRQLEQAKLAGGG